MSSLSVKLPLRYSTIDGYHMNKSFKSLVKQNLKMVLLTNPGERVMDPNFGAGLNSYLFQNFTQSTFTEIDNKIREQVKRYLPVVSIDNIVFAGTESDFNTLAVSISYTIPNIGLKDLLEFTI